MGDKLAETAARDLREAIDNRKPLLNECKMAKAPPRRSACPS